MPVEELKKREQVLQALLKKIDDDVSFFSDASEKLRKKRQELLNVVVKAGLEPIPVSFGSGKERDVLRNVENHILELNKVKNLVSMKLKRVLQEEDLVDHLNEKFGKEVKLSFNSKGLIELEVQSKDSSQLSLLLEKSSKKLDALREQVHELTLEK